jgi:hypothetical protein
MKTVITTGIFAVLIMPSMIAMAAEVQSGHQSDALHLMEQTRSYVQQEKQYRYYAATDTSNQATQDQTRSMVGADNETGQGDLNRERIRNRDGSGSGDQNKYGRTGDGNGQYGVGSGKGSGAGGGGGGSRR